MTDLIPALITTDKRGVFFGYINPDDIGKESFHAKEVQMCQYWSQDVMGVLGLAAVGPSKSSRVSKVTKGGYIYGVTLVIECSPQAVEAWKSQPWG